PRMSCWIRGGAAVEADGLTLRAGVGSAGPGRGSMIRRGRGARCVVTGAAPLVGERLSPRGDELPGVVVGEERQLQDAEVRPCLFAVRRHDGGQGHALTTRADL